MHCCSPNSVLWMKAESIEKSWNSSYHLQNKQMLTSEIFNFSCVHFSSCDKTFRLSLRLLFSCLSTEISSLAQSHSLSVATRSVCTNKVNTHFRKCFEMLVQSIKWEKYVHAWAYLQSLTEIRLHKVQNTTLKHLAIYQILIRFQTIILNKHLLHTHYKPFPVEPVCFFFWVTHGPCAILPIAFATLLLFSKPRLFQPVPMGSNHAVLINRDAVTLMLQEDSIITPCSNVSCRLSHEVMKGSHLVSWCRSLVMQANKFNSPKTLLVCQSLPHNLFNNFSLVYDIKPSSHHDQISWWSTDSDTCYRCSVYMAHDSFTFFERYHRPTPNIEEFLIHNPDSVLRYVHTQCAFNPHLNLHWLNPDGMRIDHVHMRSSNRAKFILNFAWLLLSHVTYEVHAIDVLALDFRLNYVWLCWKHQSNRRRREINQRRRHQARMRCILLSRRFVGK